MKNIGLALAILTVALAGIPSYGQPTSIQQDWRALSKKIEVGMSVEEVKAILGNPKIVKVGSPHEGEGYLRDDMPDQIGQINSSSWFYLRDAEDADSCSAYEMRYSGDADSPIWTLLLHPRGAAPSEAVRKILTVKSISLKESRHISSVKPIFCVIFDKGTQVVSGTETFYLSVQ